MDIQPIITQLEADAARFHHLCCAVRHNPTAQDRFCAQVDIAVGLRLTRAVLIQCLAAHLHYVPLTSGLYD